MSDVSILQRPARPLSSGRRGLRAAMLALTLTLPILPPATASASTVDRDRHVILVDWDGFDPSYLRHARTPNLDQLAARGSLTIARGTMKTISNPSRASMSTGAYPEVNGNLAYFYDPASNTVQGQSRFLSAETIAQSLTADNHTVASVQWYMVQDHGATYTDPAHLYVQPGGSCVDRVDASIDVLNRRPVDANGQAVTVPEVPDFLAVYCNDLDSLGHAEGPNSPSMVPTLEEMDRQLGRLVQETKRVGIFSRTTFLLTSDHGMTAWSKTVQPRVLAAISALGYHPEIVPAGASPRAGTDVIIAPFVRAGTIALRGTAANDAARKAIGDALAKLPEVQRVLDRDDLKALHASPREGDFVVEPRAPYAFVEADLPAGQEQGGHASLSEINVPFIVSGAGICGNIQPDRPGLVDVAPTIAALLHSRPPTQAQGRALTEVFKPSCGHGHNSGR